MRRMIVDQTPKYSTAARHGSEIRRHWETRALTFIGSVARNVKFCCSAAKRACRVSIPLASHRDMRACPAQEMVYQTHGKPKAACHNHVTQLDSEHQQLT